MTSARSELQICRPKVKSPGLGFIIFFQGAAAALLTAIIGTSPAPFDDNPAAAIGPGHLVPPAFAP